MRPIRRTSEAEIFAVDVLHRQEAAAVGLAEIVEAADILVRHLAGDAQLVVELRRRCRVARRALGEEFQSDRMVEREILGAVHLAHAAFAEQRDEAVSPAMIEPVAKRLLSVIRPGVESAIVRSSSARGI